MQNRLLLTIFFLVLLSHMNFVCGRPATMTRTKTHSLHRDQPTDEPTTATTTSEPTHQPTNTGNPVTTLLYTKTKTQSLSIDRPTDETSSTTAQPPNTPYPVTTRVYINATFITTSPNWLVSYIRQYLNMTDTRYGTIYSVCNNTAVNMNYTCVVMFSNFTQAVDAVYGANHQLITAVSAAWLFGYTTTTDPGHNHNIDGDNKSKAPIVIGVIVGLIVVVAVVCAIVFRSRRRSDGSTKERDEANQLISVN